MEHECNVKVKSVLVSLGQYYNRTVPSAIGYGMTETSPSITQMVKGAKKYESVGGPIPNTEMKVVELETGNSLAARQTGEICMRGPQVRGKSFRFRCFPILGLGAIISFDNCGLPLPVGLFIVLTQPTEMTAHMQGEVLAVCYKL